MLVCSLAIWRASQLLADDPSNEAIDFFESKIRPLLLHRCVECHGESEPEGELNLTSKTGLNRGGTLGPVVVPGKPKESLLISAINHDEFLKMPPKEKLPTSELVLLSKWVSMGAPWPAANSKANTSEPLRKDASDTESKLEQVEFTEEQKSFWAYQPLQRPKPPNVHDADWSRSPIDAFVSEKLQAHGLEPAKPASKRDLIRRATYDLIGLPPTEDEIVSFLADESMNAFSTIVDRLLASPRYGEKWARHWLDVARFADSNGLDENIAYANAFRYRDYVISSFNQDKPYDRFVQEQIAGDLLESDQDHGSVQADSYDRFAATGFLAIGAKMLAEDDPLKMQMDIIDEQVSTVCQAFMGMTIGCARCHDHKYDPIPTADYYALAGIFKSTKTMENHKVVARWFERPLASPMEIEVMRKIDIEIDTVNASIAKLNEECRARHSPPLADSKSDIKSLYSEPEKLQFAGFEAALAEIKGRRPNPPMAMGVTEAQPEDLKIHLRGSHLVFGKLAKRRFPQILTSTNAVPIRDTASGRLELAQWMTSPDHPLTSRVFVNRVWHWHFKRGIVSSVDNFGLLGQKPTHPELLDWLANHFVDNNWSIKHLHRTIMLSQTYQMGSQYLARATEIDPENEYRWQFQRRRLTGEEIRDSIVEVGAGLDTSMYGTLMKVKNHTYVNSTGAGEVLDYANARRSIYLPVIRSGMFEVLQTLDFPDSAMSSGERQTSTAAPQALLMMNSDLVHEQTQAIAKQLVNTSMDDGQRISYAYRRVLKRTPNTDEMGAAMAFLDNVRSYLVKSVKGEISTAQESEILYWQGLCRVLISSNEFSYVE